MLATASLRNSGAKLINGMKLWRSHITTTNHSDPFSPTPDNTPGGVVKLAVAIDVLSLTRIISG
jgi:hypothetical protein